MGCMQKRCSDWVELPNVMTKGEYSRSSMEWLKISGNGFDLWLASMMREDCYAGIHGCVTTYVDILRGTTDSLSRLVDVLRFASF